MSRGLGLIQVKIKEALRLLWSKNLPTRFGEIEVYLVANHDGGADFWFERSARRALDGLIERGDVIVVGGAGTSKDPRSFLTVEDFGALSSKKPRNIAEAKEIAAEALNNPILAQMIPGMVYTARQKMARARRKAARH
jgi:hypothetical protein